MKNLGDWIRGEYKTQTAFAEELGVQQSRVSKWLGGEPIPKAYQDKIRALKYRGPWPTEEAQDAAAGGPAPYVTREEFAELRGALKAHVEQWERGQEKVLQRLEDALRRIEQLERGAS